MALEITDYTDFNAIRIITDTTTHARTYGGHEVIFIVCPMPRIGRTKTVQMNVMFIVRHDVVTWWLGGVVVSVSDSRSKGQGFDSRPVHQCTAKQQLWVSC